MASFGRYLLSVFSGDSCHWWPSFSGIRSCSRFHCWAFYPPWIPAYRCFLSLQQLQCSFWRTTVFKIVLAIDLFSAISFSQTWVLASDFSNRSSTFSMCPSSLSSFDEQFSTLPSNEDSVSLHFPESPLKQLSLLVEGSTYSAALWTRSASPAQRNLRCYLSGRALGVQGPQTVVPSSMVLCNFQVR